MSSDTNSVHSEDAQGSSNMASPFSQDTPSSHNTARSRLVRIGSTDDSVQSTPGQSGNGFTKNFSGGAGGSPLDQQNSSSLLGVSFMDGFSGTTSSLLLPPSRGLGERAAANLRSQRHQQQQQRQVEEEALLNLLSGERPPQTPTVATVGDLKTNLEPRSGAKKQLSVRNGSGKGAQTCDSESTSPLLIVVNSNMNYISGGWGGGIGSRPGSPPWPGSTLGAAASGFSPTAPAYSATCGATVTSVSGNSLKQASDTNNGAVASGKRTTSPSMPAAASTAVLFPTSEWIRTALGKDGDTATAATAAVLSGNATAAVLAGTASSPTGTVVGGGGPSQSPGRDTAMRLHEQRVKAALRSQDEMREFSGILRRLEEKGAEVLREQRRRRRDRRGCQRWSFAGNRATQHAGRWSYHALQAAPTVTNSDTSRNRFSKDGQQQISHNCESGLQSGKSADDDASDEFSHYTGIDEGDDEDEDEDEDTNSLGLGAVAGSEDALLRSGNTGGNAGSCTGSRSSARVTAEVYGAENMSRVALFKLRDRTAREWVTLQRRRLEQRRAGPTALQRHLHASQQRLQSARTRSGGNNTGTNEPLLLLGNGGTLADKNHHNTAVTVPSVAAAEKQTKTATAVQGMAAASPLSDAAGLTLHPVTGSSLVISWGEENAAAAAEEQRGNNAVTGCEEHRRTGDACSIASASDDKAAGEEGSTLGRLQEEALPLMGEASNESRAAEQEKASSTMLVSPLSEHSRHASVLPQQESGAAAENAANPTTVSAPAATTTLTENNPLVLVNSLLEDERLRRELQRLLFQTNEDTLYGLEQCLNSKTKSRPTVPTTAQTAHGKPRTGAAAPAFTNDSLSKRSPRETSSGGWGGNSLTELRQYSPPSVCTSRVSDRRGPSLPVPLHRSFTNAVNPGSGSISTTRVAGRTIGGSGGSHAAGWTQTVSRTQSAAISTSTAAVASIAYSERTRLSQISFVETDGAESSSGGSPIMVSTPTTIPLLPPLHTPSPLSSSPPPAPPLSGAHTTAAVCIATLDAKRGGSTLDGPALPPVSLSKLGNICSKSDKGNGKAEASTQKQQQRQSPPHCFSSFNSRKKHQRTPLPVERGVGEHAAALLHHEILVTRRHEMEAERGNTREIDRACATLQQLRPLRQQLLDQDLQKVSNSSNRIASQGLTSAGQLSSMLLKNSAHTVASTGMTDFSFGKEAGGSGGIGADRHSTRHAKTAAAIDRSYHPQAILQRHRQLLYDEAVRMDVNNRYTARNAYLDVLAQLAQRRVSSISWPVVESLLNDARKQLRQEAEVATPPGSAGSSESHGVSPDRTTAALTPRDKLQQLIADHLGVLELSQWPVQEVLQHLAALYRVPLHLLHEGIAEQQRRFAHTYNYEERFRAVDRTLVGSASGADSILRLTLHRCRRPPLAPIRDGSDNSNNTTKAAGSGAQHVATAAAQVLGMPSLDPRGEALYYIRLRVGQQSTSSSAVPLSSAAAGGSGGAQSVGGAAASFASAGGYGGGGGDTYGSTMGGEKGDEGAAGRATGSRMLPTSSSSSSAKLLSFLGQTLTVYLPTSDTAARNRRTGIGTGSRQYGYLTSHSNTNYKNHLDGDAGEEENADCVVTVELMQTGVEAPLARGEVNLNALGLNTYGDNGRVRAQNVQIPLRRKGYRTAELKATLEVT